MFLQSPQRYYGATPAAKQLVYHGIVPCLLYDLRQTPEKGHGLFAKADIDPGTRIISEAPLISISTNESLPEIFNQYLTLGPTGQNLFLGFHSFEQPERDLLLEEKLAARGFPEPRIGLMVKVAAVFQANAFNVSTVAEVRRAMFKEVARINHSCMPNAHTYFNPSSGRMDVHAISHIKHGEEILISYFNTLSPRQERRERSKAWGFACDCPVCDVENPEQATHEQRRLRLAEMQAALQHGTMLLAGKLLSIMRELRAEIGADESLSPVLPHLTMPLGRMLNQTILSGEQMVEVDDFFQHAVEVERRITGEGSDAHRMLLYQWEDIQARLRQSETAR